MKNETKETAKNFANAFLVASLAIFALLFAVVSSSVWADSLVFTGLAWHAAAHNRGAENRNYNEVNPGLGYEYTIDDTNVIAFGYYENSFYRHSNYLMLGFQPYYLQTDYGVIKLGVYTGQVTGYTTRTFNIVSLPMASYEYKQFGVNLAFLPAPPINKCGVIAIQFKWRFDK